MPPMQHWPLIITLLVFSLYLADRADRPHTANPARPPQAYAGR